MHSSLSPPASWRPVFVLHCFSVDLSSSLLSTSLLSSPHTPRSFFSLHCLFLSSLWHAFYKLDYNDCMRWQETTDSAESSLMIFWCLAATVWTCVRAHVWMCARRRERLLTVLCVSVLQVWCVWSLARQSWSSSCCFVPRSVTSRLTPRRPNTSHKIHAAKSITHSECIFFPLLIHVIIGVTRGAVKLLICVARQGWLCNERIADVIQYLLLRIIAPQFSLINIKATKNIFPCQSHDAHKHHLCRFGLYRKGRMKRAQLHSSRCVLASKGCLKNTIKWH